MKPKRAPEASWPPARAETMQARSARTRSDVIVRISSLPRYCSASLLDRLVTVARDSRARSLERDLGRLALRDRAHLLRVRRHHCTGRVQEFRRHAVRARGGRLLLHVELQRRAGRAKLELRDLRL